MEGGEGAVPETELDALDAGVVAAMQELNKTHESLQQVTSYCQSIYATSDKPDELMEGTRKYTSDALQNVVYHVHNVALQISTYLEVQTAEIDKLDLKVKLLSERMKLCHDVTGAAPKHSLVAEKAYHPDFPAERKLQEHELPPPHQPWVRRVLPSGEFDLSVLDKVGTSN